MTKLYFKLVILGTMLLCVVACDKKKNNLSKIEKELATLYDDDYVTFEEKLTDLILSDTSSISYPFKLLDDCVSTTMSKDGNLRFYDWITPFGGTMLSYGNIFQYRSDSKVFAFKYTPWDYDENNNPIEGYDNDRGFIKIHTVKIKDKTYYLVEDWKRYDSAHGMGSINAFVIENNKLKAKEIFKTKNSILSSIAIEYCFRDWYFIGNNGEGFKWIFSFDENTNTLYVPLINDDISYGYVTDQYLLYQLKDDCLQYIGRDGGFWLHPSIRKFNYLISISETENYKIRIDYTGNEKYRYVSWKKGKSMDSKPDLIIENGIIKYDAEAVSYVFKVENYKYTYFTTIEKGLGCLTVENNGKEILREKIE